MAITDAKVAVLRAYLFAGTDAEANDVEHQFLMIAKIGHRYLAGQAASARGSDAAGPADESLAVCSGSGRVHGRVEPYSPATA